MNLSKIDLSVYKMEISSKCAPISKVKYFIVCLSLTHTSSKHCPYNRYQFLAL